MFAAYCFAALISALSPSQGVTGPSIGNRDQPIEIEHKAGATVSVIFNNARGEFLTLPEAHFKRGETSTVFAAPPGDYFVTDGDFKILRIVEEGKPQPGPPDDEETDDEEDVPPKPVPPNPNKLDVKYALWIYEQSDAINEPEATKVRLDKSTRDYLASKSIKFFAYDDDQPEAKPYLIAVDRLPALILMESSKEFESHPAPKSLDELKKRIDEARR